MKETTQGNSGSLNTSDLSQFCRLQNWRKGLVELNVTIIDLRMSKRVDGRQMGPEKRRDISKLIFSFN
jgi:hypothetical protein